MIRINKFLAQCNLGSRRGVESIIKDGKVKVNGKVVTDLSMQIDPDNDEVVVGRKKVALISDKIYIMLNKPKKYLVTASDDFDRKTVFHILPDFGVHLFAVGRLDYMSEGLLLLTSDGDFADRIIHPRYKLPKVYKVLAKGAVTDEQIEKLRNGVVIEGKMTQKAIVHVKSRSAGKTVIRITIFEGRKRQIRYMMKAVGSEVLELKRLQIGDVKLGSLTTGMWRVLKPSEITNMLRQSGQNRKTDQKNDK